ncbi:MAG TPA: hypothetical protein DIW17_07870 [Clostridiales bacterium]|nr:hypothetical protein [Clostridiales bacterium]
MIAFDRKKYDSLKIRQEKILERYFTLKRPPGWDKYLSNKGYQKVLNEQNQVLYEIATVDDNLLKVPAYIPYTKKDGSPYTYIDFSKITLMNALKSAVYNMCSRMKDTAKEYFKDYRELSKFLKVLLQTGGYYEEGEHQDTVHLNSLETPAYQLAAEQLINNINQQSPGTLGKDSKPLVLKLKR